MATFVYNQEQVSTVPTIDVSPGMAPGRYNFSLVVEDDSGGKSAPVMISVLVLPLPKAVLEAKMGTTVVTQVHTGDTFTLDASKSTSDAGKVVKYHFTMVLT